MHEEGDMPETVRVQEKPDHAGPLGGKRGIFYVGMDLGTYKTSVAATNGVRETIVSIVGYPKDPVSKKMLGRDIIFGEEVIRHRLACEVVRPFEKGFLKYSQDGNVDKTIVEKAKKAAAELVNYSVSACRPPKGDLVYGVIGAPSRASIHNKQALLEACRGTFDAVMIVSEPFAVAYGLNILEDALIVDIGAGTVDICRMHGTIPTEEDQITFTTAGDYLDEEFLKLVQQKHKGVQISINMARDIKERFSFVHDVNEVVKVTLPIDGKPTEVDLTQELKAACRKIVPNIVAGIQKLIATYDPEFQKRMRSNILLAGGGSQVRGLDRLIEEALVEYGGGNVRKVQEPVYAGANGALKLATDMPEDYWKEISK